MSQGGINSEQDPNHSNSNNVSPFLNACGNNNSKSDNTLSEAKLTEREEVMLSASSDTSFVFDFNVDNTYKELSVWVEKYEFGKKVGDNINEITMGINDKGTIIFTTAEAFDKQNQSVFNISINSDGSTGKGSGLEPIIGQASSTWGSNPVEDNLIKGKMVLANISYLEDGNSISSLSADFYKDIDSHMNEINR